MEFEVRDLGLLGYEDAASVQESILGSVIDRSLKSTLLLVEHPPVMTLGADFHSANLLLPREEYLSRGISTVVTGRGGDVTYHGPGQLVAYPIFDLGLVGKDLHLWLRNLEQVVLNALTDFGIEGRRFAPHTGVWVGDDKIAAIGIKVRRWVSMHGLALNCDVDLGPFETIVPCGIRGYGVTSMARVLGRGVSVTDVKPAIVRAFREVFGEV